MSLELFADLLTGALAPADAIRAALPEGSRKTGARLREETGLERAPFYEALAELWEAGEVATDSSGEYWR